jgi:hypothetical protein
VLDRCLVRPAGDGVSPAPDPRTEWERLWERSAGQLPCSQEAICRSRSIAWPRCTPGVVLDFHDARLTTGNGSPGDAWR